MEGGSLETYINFLNSKKIESSERGIDIDISLLNPALFDFQKDIVRWSLRLGRSAMFEDCGLGKTLQQLEWGNQIYKHTGKNILIFAPLAVSSQTKDEGDKFGIDVNIANSQKNVTPGINITNYEKLHLFDPNKFIGVVLDESSIIKSFTGKIKNQIVNMFKNTPYKLACTATPAPNDHMELGNHSEFLNIMPSNEMLSRWFINDTMHFGTYRLKGHAVKSFWEWVASWAICIRKPSDLGYSDEKFILPPLNMQQIIIPIDQTENSGGKLYRTVLMNATSLHKEMRLTAPARAAKVAEIVNKSNEYWVVWCNTNYEADALKKLLPDAVEVRGAEKQEIKENKLRAFTRGDIKIIITKPSIAGWGLNWQHCHNIIFMGLSYSYEQLYQAIRRSHRFGQNKQVNVYIVIAETEGNVLRTIFQKMKSHEEMQNNMYKTNFTKSNQKRKVLIMDVQENTVKNKKWEMVNADCVEYSKKIESDFIHFSIFSPPFSNLYIYSDSIRDLGNCKNDKEFFRHFSYLIPELYRITKPGRLCAVHCKNLVNYKGRDGKAGLRDFRGDIIREFLKHNWTYHSEVCIWKDPVIEMQRTKAQGLLYKQLRKDSSFCRQGLPEYLLIFRKWAEDGEQIEPVQSNSCGDDPKFDRYVGSLEIPIKKDNNPHYYAIQVWQRYASPVWMDIRQTNVLNAKVARDAHDEKHICPLQLDVIEKSLELWTNKDDLVFDPFAGIGSTGYISIKTGRRFKGIELKKQYFEQATKYIMSAENQNRQLSLF